MRKGRRFQIVYVTQRVKIVTTSGMEKSYALEDILMGSKQDSGKFLQNDIDLLRAAEITHLAVGKMKIAAR